MLNLFLRLGTCLLASTLATACVDDASASDTTQASSGSGAPGGPHAPPPEAFAACASSGAGATCAFDLDAHHVDGTCCRTGPDGSGALACAPAHPPLPPEAIAACASSSAGATCAFDLDGHHVDGTCRNGPDGSGPLACAPSGPPPH